MRVAACTDLSSTLLAWGFWRVLLDEAQHVRMLASRDLSSTLLAWGFWRVLLDEAQLVAQSSSVAAQKASSLWRRHAWTVTGTPLSHHLSEMKVPSLFAVITSCEHMLS